jgi:uncharacterized protein (DUF2236 family)
VAATLLWAGRRVHELIEGPMPPELAAQVLAAQSRLGTALRVPPERWPADQAAFDAYWTRRLRELAVGDDARGIARDVLHPRVGPLWLRAGMPLGRLITAGLLPASVREGYGLPWSAARRRRCALAIRVVRDVVRLLPRRVRQWPSRMLLAGLRAHAARIGAGADGATGASAGIRVPDPPPEP